MDKDLNFRHIIKTFIPGLFASISLLLIFDLLCVKLFSPEAHSWIKLFIEGNSALIVSLMIPISLFIGITINTFCFVYLIPWIFERHKKKEKQNYENGIKRKDNFNFYEFCDFKDSVCKYMDTHYYNHLFSEDFSIEFEVFKRQFDLGSFLMHRKNIANLHYIKTGYWYYLEFQLNSIISITLGLIAINLNLFCRKIEKIEILGKFAILFSTLIIGYLLFALLYKAIIKNLERDKKKELSYILGAYHICRIGKSPT